MYVTFTFHLHFFVKKLCKLSTQISSIIIIMFFNILVFWKSLQNTKFVQIRYTRHYYNWNNKANVYICMYYADTCILSIRVLVSIHLCACVRALEIPFRETAAWPLASRRTGLLLLAAALLPLAAAYGVPRQPQPPQQAPSYQQSQQEISPILFPSESGPEQQKVSVENWNKNHPCCQVSWLYLVFRTADFDPVLLCHLRWRLPRCVAALPNQYRLPEGDGDAGRPNLRHQDAWTLRDGIRNAGPDAVPDRSHYGCPAVLRHRDWVQDQF